MTKPSNYQLTLRLRLRLRCARYSVLCVHYAAPVHVRTGPHTSFDTLFCKVRGLHWRSEFDNTTTVKHWRMRTKEFVIDACRALSLPHPYPGNRTPKNSIDFRKDSCGYVLTLPKPMRRDTLWSSHGPTELEFVVDNKSVAGLANIETKISNEYYRPVVDRLRSGLKELYTSCFGFKGGFLPPVDWRPREYNGPPDVVCNWILERRSAVEDISETEILDAVRQRDNLQIHCDGGFVAGAGAAAFVIHRVSRRTNTVSRLGHCGVFLQSAESAFHTELSAIESAVNFVRRIMHALER